MHRLERLLNLVAALLAAERLLGREELHERVPGYPDDDASFRRAFERDKDALRAMGIPIVIERFDPTDPSAGEGYRIPKEDYYLPDPDLAPDELAALHVAATAVRLEGVEGGEAIWKLGGAPEGDDAVATLAALPGSEHLSAVFTAVAERRTLRFGYRGEERTVDPWRLAFRNGHWYLVGRDHDRDAERSFRLDRLDSAPREGPARAFERPPEPPRRFPAPWEMGDDEEAHARVRVDADRADRVVERLGPDAVVERDDAGVVVRMRVTNRAAFRTFVLGLLDRAEVVSPPELRDDMARWLEAIAAS
jgi:proteasome accessory factor B